MPGVDAGAGSAGTDADAGAGSAGTDSDPEPSLARSAGGSFCAADAACSAAKTAHSDFCLSASRAASISAPSWTIVAGSEETERKALLDRCAQYDAILDHLNAKTGDAKPAKDTSDVHTTSTHGMDFAQQVRPPARPTPRTPGQFRPSFSRTERGATWFFARERTTLRARNAPSSRTSAAAIDPRDARKPTTRADARLPPSTNAQTASGFDAPDSATRLPAPLIRAGASRFSANSQTVFPYVDLTKRQKKKPGAMRASEAHSVDRATSRGIAGGDFFAKTSRLASCRSIATASRR